jgi:hypothetical protein
LTSLQRRHPQEHQRQDRHIVAARREKERTGGQRDQDLRDA